MSRKKSQKRHQNSSVSAKQRAAQEELADRKDRARKRMDPTARLLLLGDLVFLALFQILYSNGMLSENAYTATSLVGLAVLIAALWFQFGNHKGKHGGPRLR